MPIFVVVKNSNLLPHPAISGPIGQPLTVLASIDSTNNYAMAQAVSGAAAHGSAYFALEQTAGKGQRGRTWLTTPGENIMMSTVIRPAELPFHQQFLLSAAMALACYDFFKKYAGDETRIKWPNDIYWRDRKAAGILIENRLEPGNAQWQWAIVGMGVNINQTSFGEGTKNPVSLKQITGKTFEVETMAAELCSFQEKWWQVIVSGELEKLMPAYHDALYKLNEEVRLKKENGVFSTRVSGVTANGQLHTKDVIDRYFDVGEVEWVLG
ncbi:biotin--[acetyl-CoA-carboxylase] ligase [Pseudoflavitalea sp. G-6-1-2]|nr:biotin--[acetyl-CoA-carboxylase] ligase [Pseudoflavitalea sp. G-6-1-2]